MTTEEVFQFIEAATARVLTDGGKEPVRVAADTPLWGPGGAMDSLDLAVLVVELEEFVGKDPFKDGFINFRTAGELAALYGG